jgi:quinolinate synthase
MSINLEFTPEIQSKTDELYKKIQGTIPKIEWPTLAPYIFEINKIKKEKGVTILAHNYQAPEIYYGVADIVGDSLGLAIDGRKVDTDKILMCGVHFMAETAKIMSPEKKFFYQIFLQVAH